MCSAFLLAIHEENVPGIEKAPLPYYYNTKTGEGQQLSHEGGEEGDGHRFSARAY